MREESELETPTKIDKKVFFHGVLPLMCLVGAFIFILGRVFG